MACLVRHVTSVGSLSLLGEDPAWFPVQGSPCSLAAPSSGGGVAWAVPRGVLGWTTLWGKGSGGHRLAGTAGRHTRDGKLCSAGPQSL